MWFPKKITISIHAPLFALAFFGTLPHAVAAEQCNCSCPCSTPQTMCQNQQPQTQQNQTQQKQPAQPPPWGTPPANGALVYNPWYAENSVPYFSAYPFVSTPYIIFDRPVPPPIPAPPPLAAR